MHFRSRLNAVCTFNVNTLISVCAYTLDYYYLSFNVHVLMVMYWLIKHKHTYYNVIKMFYNHQQPFQTTKSENVYYLIKIFNCIFFKY